MLTKLFNFITMLAILAVLAFIGLLMAGYNFVVHIFH